MNKIKEFEKQIGLKFKNPEILKQALVHRSYLNEHPDFKLEHNERLEFLGDAVLQLIVTKVLFKKFAAPEGDLTVWRASLVNSKTLSRIGKELKIDKYLYLSKGEQNKNHHSILANTFESLIGAIYLDLGFGTAEKFVQKYILSQLENILKKRLYRDAKTDLQELIQGKFKSAPCYQVLKESGPDHNKRFKIGVYLNEQLLSAGFGESKKLAEEKAAQNALKSKIVKKIKK